MRRFGYLMLGLVPPLLGFYMHPKIGVAILITQLIIAAIWSYNIEKK